MMKCVSDYFSKIKKTEEDNDKNHMNSDDNTELKTTRSNSHQTYPNTVNPQLSISFKLLKWLFQILLLC